MSIENEKIDVVYLWCDGNDPAFRERKEKRLREFGLSSLEQGSEEAIGEMRYIDNDELKYSLRSLHQSIPWVNHIWIITDNQRPSWLKENGKLSIVDHTEVLPSTVLPCFNSKVIETHGILNITQLSEKFIYCNDDMFFLGKLDKSFFFDENGYPISRLHKNKHIISERISAGLIKSPEEIDETIRMNLDSEWMTTVLRAWKESCMANGWHDFYELCHVPDAMTKSVLRHVLRKFPNLKKCNINAFRTDREIQRVLIQYEMVFGLGYKFQLSHKERVKKYLSLVFPFFGMKDNNFVDTLCSIESPEYFKRIIRWRPRLFCINASPSNDTMLKRQTHNFLEKLFPKKSPYEI